jgi:two-component sensor histidine kinase/PAS domain-containing protein
MSEPEPPTALALKRDALATGGTRTGSVAVAVSGGGVHHFDLTVSPTRGADGSPDGLLGTAVDVTERRLFDVRLAAMAAQAAAAYRRFDLALEDSAITVFEQDAEGRYTFMHNPPPGTEPDGFLGRTDAEVFGEFDQRKLSSLKRRIFESGERGATELELAIGGEQRFYALRLDPKTVDSGKIEGVIGTAVDLTQRRRHEKNMELVMRELTHRSKNLLAVVQAMARKTASTAPDTDTFIRDFSSRLRAIAAAHDLLVAESWSGADLHDLLAASLSQTVDPKSPEVRVDGPGIKLTPDAAQMLGLAFHELTMNAVRYGALSVPGGRICVRWRHDGDAVRLCWSEEGGPEVGQPRRSGFGRVLLERLVGASLGGTVSLDFRSDGLVCVLTFPKERLTAG